MSWFRWDGADLVISLHVQPGARTPGIAGLHGDALKLRVKAPPEAGRANREVVELLAKQFAVPPAAVSVKRGATSRRKTVQIVSPNKLPDLPGLSGPVSA